MTWSSSLNVNDHLDLDAAAGAAEATAVTIESLAG